MGIIGSSGIKARCHSNPELYIFMLPGEGVCCTAGGRLGLILRRPLHVLSVNAWKQKELVCPVWSCCPRSLSEDKNLDGEVMPGIKYQR